MDKSSFKQMQHLKLSKIQQHIEQWCNLAGWRHSASPCSRRRSHDHIRILAEGRFWCQVNSQGGATHFIAIVCTVYSMALSTTFQCTNVSIVCFVHFSNIKCCWHRLNSGNQIQLMKLENLLSTWQCRDLILQIGAAPLYYATMWGATATAEVLMKSGADVNATDSVRSHISGAITLTLHSPELTTSFQEINVSTFSLVHIFNRTNVAVTDQKH